MSRVDDLIETKTDTTCRPSSRPAPRRRLGLLWRAAGGVVQAARTQRPRQNRALHLQRPYAVSVVMYRALPYVTQPAVFPYFWVGYICVIVCLFGPYTFIARLCTTQRIHATTQMSHLVVGSLPNETIRNAAFENALTPWRARLKVALLTERRICGRDGQPIRPLKLRRARESRLRRH